MIALIGSEGSMGKRYQAIFRHLSLAYMALDKTKDKEQEIERAVKAADRILIATPTESHVELLLKYLPLKKPILCEKPITKSLDALIDLHALCARSGFQYQMVMQYKELQLPLKTPDRWSYYNYFRHGNDGLAWDCIQIIGLAQGPVWLKEESPVWECTINGKALSLAEMDHAYVEMIRRWVTNSLDQSMDEILHIHKKVHSWKELHEPTN